MAAPNQRLQYKLAKRKIGGNTSVFRFEANSLQFVIDIMNNKPHLPQQFNLEQRWLSHALEGRMKWWPSEWVTSFKHKKPIILSVCVFLLFYHGMQKLPYLMDR